MRNRRRDRSFAVTTNGVICAFAPVGLWYTMSGVEERSGIASDTSANEAHPLQQPSARYLKISQKVC
jgi:hypothetical protein